MCLDSTFTKNEKTSILLKYLTKKKLFAYIFNVRLTILFYFVCLCISLIFY